MRTQLCYLIAVIMFSGCAVQDTGQVTSISEIDATAQSLFILGVPETARVVIVPGRVEDGVFRAGFFDGAALAASPRDGYVVGKATSGDVLALQRIEWYADGEKTSLSKKGGFSACGKEALVFQIPADAQVVYVADIMAYASGPSMVLSARKNFRGAKTYVDGAFPELQGSVKDGEFQWLPARC